MYFSLFWRLAASPSGCQYGGVLGVSRLPGLPRAAVLLCPHVDSVLSSEASSKLSCLFSSGLSSQSWGPHLPKAPLSHWGLGFQHRHLGRDTNTPSMTNGVASLNSYLKSSDLCLGVALSIKPFQASLDHASLLSFLPLGLFIPRHQSVCSIVHLLILLLHEKFLLFRGGDWALLPL